MHVRRGIVGLGQGGDMMVPAVTSLVAQAQASNVDLVPDLYGNLQYGQVPALSTQTTGTPTPASPQTLEQLSGDPRLWTPQQAASIGASAYATAVSNYITAQEAAGTYNPEGNIPGLTSVTDFFGSSTLGLSNVWWVLGGVAAVGLFILWKK